MINPASIQQVRDLPIIDVLSPYIKLKQRGNKATACCPFHNESTASFNVSNTKGIYKCFGCGRSGDAIRFVMETDKLEFIPAIEAIAKNNGIALEYTEPADPEKYKQEQTLLQQQLEVINRAAIQYHENLLKLPADHPVIRHLLDRGYTKHTIIKWRIGWCTPEWRQITERLINDGLYEAAKTIGIIRTTQKDNSHFDAYRSRITFPIQNAQGKFIGMGGRWMPIDANDITFKAAKYINSNSEAESIYQKSQTLYGLYYATAAIKRTGFTWLVEGYTDTISMHAYGDANTIATCGTALTMQQAQLIKKYSNHVILLRDGDKAGQAAAARDLPILLQAGIKVSVGTLPDKQDPCDFILSIKAKAA